MKRLSIALTAMLLSAGTGLLADDAGPKPERRGPEQRNPEQLFSNLDKDSDGTLSKDEVPEEQVRFFERLVRVGDKNDDGQLSKEEFVAAMNQQEPRADAGPEGGRPGFGPGGGRPGFDGALFDLLDANKDGKLTREELPERARERMGQLFERLGKDELTREDLERMQERFGGPGRPGQGRPGEGRPGEGRPGEGRFGPELLERLRAMDANKDGKVTMDEVPAEAKERVQQMLDRMGRDAVDLEQMARMIEQGGPRRPEGREGDRPRPEGREGDRPRPEGREGDRPRPEGGDRPPMPRDGDRPPMPRDGERPPMPRDGDRPDMPRGGFGGPPLFMLLDEDRDGHLSQKEFEALAGKFKELDRNSDGQLDRAELMGFGPGGPFGPPRDGEGRPRDGEGRPRDGFGPPRDGEGRPRDGFGPPRDGDRRPPEGDRPRDGERRPQRPESEEKI